MPFQVKPVGKIVISDKTEHEEERKGCSSKRNSSKQSSIAPTSGLSSCCDTDADSNDMQDDEDDDECNSSEEELKPLAGKKMQKNLNDQRFTIETTVKVGKCGGDRKKGGKNGGVSNEAKCLPFVPPEPTPLKKKKKISNCRET